MMAEDNACYMCGSDKIIPHVRIVDRAHSNMRRDLEVEVYEKPDALLFKGTHRSTLTARICGSCGYTEMFVSNPQELWSTYRSKRPR